MYALLCMIRKEFRQLRRDRAMVAMSLFVPTIQLLILAYAINNDLRAVRVSVLDDDRSALSRRLAEALYETDVFVPGPRPAGPAQVSALLARGETDLAVSIPRGFARSLLEGRALDAGLVVDGTNSSIGGRAAGYAQAVLIREATRSAPRLPAGTIKPATRFFYNPELESRLYMLPGIMVMLVTIITAFGTAMAVVREKELGTLEQVQVTPLRSVQFVAGKLAPFAIVGLIDLGLAVLVAMFWFHVPFVGSPGVVLLGVLGYLGVTLALGLIASSVSSTQQQAMFSTWFFLIFAMMLSGFFFPVENMPDWAYALTWLDPMRFLVRIMRGVLLKGAGLADLARDLIILAGMGAVAMTAAIASFKKTSA